MALSTNCLLGVNNKVDLASGFTGGSTAVTFPLTNLQRADLSRPWRSAAVTPPSAAGRDVTAGRTWIEIDLGSGQVFQMIALIAHNLTQAATIRVRASDSSTFASDVYDTGAVAAWPTIAGFGSLPWGVFAWGGALAVTDAPYYSISSYLLLPDPVSARHVRIEINDGFNPAGFLQVGRAFVGPIWQPSLNMELDWSIGWEDPSEPSRAIGGWLTFDERPRYRVASFTLGHLPEAEASTNILDYMDRRKGIAGDLIFIPQPTKPETWIHEALYGRQRRLDPLRSPYWDFRRTRGFEIEELR